jgi:hypothetical protein
MAISCEGISHLFATLFSSVGHTLVGFFMNPEQVDLSQK